MILTCHCGLTRRVADCPCGLPTFTEAELIELENVVLAGWERNANDCDAFGKADRVVTALRRLIELARSGDSSTPMERELLHAEYLNSEFGRIQAAYPVTANERTARREPSPVASIQKPKRRKP